MRNRLSKLAVVLGAFSLLLLHHPQERTLSARRSKRESKLQLPNTLSPLHDTQTVKQKKERAKISKTGAWIISDQYEYLLDKSLADQLVTFFQKS